jgi:hypothetical protein
VRSRFPAPSAGRRSLAVGLIVGVTSIVCLVNAGLSVQATRQLSGPQPEALERRYGALRTRLVGTARVAYVSDARWRFLEARYALAPTILDPGYVRVRPDERSIAEVDVRAIADDAAVRPPIVVLCDFDDAAGLAELLDDLSAELEDRGLAVREISHTGGVALLSLGD